MAYWIEKCDVVRKERDAALKTDQEPVAYANADTLDNMLDDRGAVVSGVRDGFYKVPLYTHPAPVVSSDPVEFLCNIESSDTPTPIYAAPTLPTNTDALAKVGAGKTGDGS